MPKSIDPSSLLNPMTWTDAGLRALEMAVSSTQNISEGVDRLTRAGADAELLDGENSNFASPAARDSGRTSWVSMAADLQRSSFEVVTQSWLQWISMLNNFMSMSAGFPSAKGLSWQILPMEAMRRSMSPIGLPPESFSQMRPNEVPEQHSARQGQAHARSGSGREHAVASVEPKRRRSTSRTSRTKSKARRSRNS